METKNFLFSFLSTTIITNNNNIIIIIIRRRNMFGETYGVSPQIIRRMQSVYKTCEVKLILKKQERILPQEV